MNAEIKAERQAMLDRLRAAGQAAKARGGAPKGKRNGKAIGVRTSAYREGEKAANGMRLPLDF